MSEKELLKKRQEWHEKLKREGNSISPTESHKRRWDALQNPIRRGIVEFIGIVKKKNLEEIKERFELDSNQAKFHLSMLENALLIEEVEENREIFYTLTTRAEAYLKNVKLGPSMPDERS